LQTRKNAELAYADAQNKAIDTQLEAAKIFEDFGGEKLSTASQLGAAVSQFNNVAGRFGGGLTTGTADNVRAVSTRLQSSFNASANRVISEVKREGSGKGAEGTLAGSKNFGADTRDDARAANDALIQFTKQRITLLKEELSIVEKKNSAEKDSLQKLLSGDVAGFLQGQAASGAAKALRSGDSSLTSLFSSSALGAGFQTLEGQGLSDRELSSAAEAVLSRLGITGGGGALSGTTDEELAIKAQGRELAAALGDVAQSGADFASSDITIADATIIASRVIFEGELASVANQNADFKSRGGMVYASRGMFVPRGTDTVPAMLTPGEFVINRAAVKRGNNLQMLKAMNSGGGASSPGAMSGGGQVQHYQFGGLVESIGNVFQSALPDLRLVFNDFATTVDKLLNTRFSVSLDTTNVNVNFNGGSFLATLKDDIRASILDEVMREVKKLKQNSSGDLQARKTVL